MRKLVRIGLIGLGTLLIAGGGGFGFLYWRLSHPAQERLPLPSTLISFESPEGEALLQESDAKADSEALLAHFETQQKGSWCSVAGAVTVINASNPSTPLTQDGFFTDCTNQKRSWFSITFGGMSLQTFASLLECHGMKVTAHLAEAVPLDQFRAIAVENMRNPRDFLVVNYQRAVLGQKESGHLSPIGAYHSPSDRFLILDVARYKYPPVWVKAEALWNAMNTPDSGSGHTRGFAVISRD